MWHNITGCKKHHQQCSYRIHNAETTLLKYQSVCQNHSRQPASQYLKLLGGTICPQSVTVTYSLHILSPFSTATLTLLRYALFPSSVTCTPCLSNRLHLGAWPNKVIGCLQKPPLCLHKFTVCSCSQWHFVLLLTDRTDFLTLLCTGNNRSWLRKTVRMWGART